MPKKYTYAEVKESIENGGLKLLSTRYISSKDKLTVLCNCGNEFRLSFEHFKRINKNQCNTCTGKTRYTIADVKGYVTNYSNASCLANEYKNNNTLMPFMCECGNVFNTTFKRFKKGKHTCLECLRTRLHGKYAKTHEVFCDEVQKVSNGEIEVVGEYYNRETKVMVKHTSKGCGNIWAANPCDLIFNKSGCPACASSKGEKAVREWLDANSVEYTEQYKTEDCANKRPLPFDFAVFNNGRLQYLVEYDGIQHFDPRCFGGEKSYCRLKDNDRIKTDYCLTNGIMLVRIPYTEKENIPRILSNVHTNL